MKTIDQLEVIAKASGFEFVRPTKHGLLFRHPLGPTWLRAGTPDGGKRSNDNARADLARAVKQIIDIESGEIPSMPTIPSLPIQETTMTTEPEPRDLLPITPTRRCGSCRAAKSEAEYSPKVRGTGKAKACDVCRLAQKNSMAKRKALNLIAGTASGEIMPEGATLSKWGFATSNGLLHRVTATAMSFAPPVSRTESQDPEAMATRVLLKRHKEEWQGLVDTFMEGLWG